MHSDVFKLTANVIKPANAIQTVYPRQNSALDISRTKISTLALFRNTEFPIAFNWKSATPNSLGIKRQKVPQLSFKKYNFLLYLINRALQQSYMRERRLNKIIIVDNYLGDHHLIIHVFSQNSMQYVHSITGQSTAVSLTNTQANRVI